MIRYPLAAALLLSAAQVDASASELVSLDVYPEQVTLHHAEDRQRVIAVATRGDGTTRDVTDEVRWEVLSTETDQGAFACEEAVVSAGRNGLARLRAELGGLSAEVDLHAVAVDKQRDVSFRHDVIPIFLRTGCNAGGCHGSSRGKDGFMLSLFGYDPSGDHHRLTREQIGRRINYALPDESLLLTKSIASAPHTGGKRFERDSYYYRKLHDWIDRGAPSDVSGAPTVTAVRLYPPKATLESGGEGQRFVAVAEYSDGATRDVSHLALFQSNNESAAAIDENGNVTPGRPGESFVMARFDTHTVGSQVLSLAPGDGFEPLAEAPANYIDELVGAKLDTMRITPSGPCSDAEFLRRVSIDIAGRLPTPEELTEFAASEDPAKRSAAVDRLLGEPAFCDIWAGKWADLLLVREENNRVDYKPMFLYARWLREQIASHRPLDEMVRDLIAARGTTFDTPATNFYQIEPDPKKVAENVAQAMLGQRIQCAQCHNHPFDRWTMDDYYAFTSFFTQVGRKRGEDYREWIIYDRGSGDARNPVDNRVMKPKYLGGDQAEPEPGVTRREQVAEWITSPDNPYFAPSVANRVWAHFFGMGIVDPVDDIRISNPPSNPELFETLGQKLVEYDYDLRRLVADICTSNTYQRSSLANPSNEADTRNFARCIPRRLPAETLLDCLSQATESPEKLSGLPLGAKAVEIAGGNPRNYFLQAFGRSSRQSVCACGATTDPTLSQALHLINGATTNDKIYRGGVIKRLLGEGKTAPEVIDAIYLRCLARKATPDEHAKYAEMMAEGDPLQPLEDVFWAVLNSREFVFNH
ncbi:MAG: DUF1549 and DUF1553 domain-containing protein [Planctomycetota bacterium]